MSFDDTYGLSLALEQARKSYSEGGIPIGGALISLADDGTRTTHAASHNKRVQLKSAILHGETATLEEAGRLKADVYRRSTLVCAIMTAIPR